MAISTDSLISAWRMNANTGVTFDSWGTNTLTNNGSIATTTGLLDEAAGLLKASSQRLSIASPPSTLGTLQTTFEIDGWFQMADSSGDQVIVCLGSPGAGGGQPAYRGFYRQSNNSFQFQLWDDNTVAANVALWPVGAPALNTWHYFNFYHDQPNNLVGVILNDGTPVTTARTVDLGVGTANFNLGGVGVTPTLNGKLDSIFFWRRLLTAGERTERRNAGAGAEPTLRTVTIIVPSNYQLHQRNASTLQASIAISGTYTGAASAIEASWAGGAYSTIAASPSGGTFAGSLTGQTAGQGTFSVRFANEPATAATKTDVGVGELFCCSGQSNMSGRGTNNQTYSHGSLKAVLFGNDYLWKELVDPYDSSTNQVDTVSSDTAAGSFIPLLATKLMASLGVPVGFVPCAKGASSALSFLPSADHSDRATRYGSMNYRMTQVGGVRMVLWWLGETDAAAATSQATFNSRLDTIVNAINADQSIKTMVCKIQNCTDVSIPAGALDVINAAIVEAWNDNANVRVGPDLSGSITDDGFHLTTNLKLDSAATLWAHKILLATKSPKRIREAIVFA